MEEHRFRATEDSVEYEEFFNAASGGDVERLEAALLPSLDVNALEADRLQGRAALHMAAQTGSVQAIKFLLTRGAKVDLRNSEYETPLHEAAFYAHPEAINALLDAGSNIHLKTGDYNYTALHNVLKHKNAITSQQIEAIELLLDRGSHVNAEADSWGSTLIDQASALRSVELVRVLIDRGARLNSALLCAVDNYEMVKFLLRQGAKIIAAPGKTSAITNAAGTSDTEIIQLLLSHADDAELKSSCDALNWAAAGGRLDTVNLLVEQGFDVNAFTKDCSIGETPLLAICQGKKPYPHIIRRLLERGANISIQSTTGDAPLHEAARWSNPESVQLLLSAGADTSIRNSHGDTPLIKYAYEMSGFCLNYHHLDGRGTNPRLETFKMVMQSTVGVNGKNNRGDTALHALANGRLSGHMAQGRMEAAKSLIEKGADVSSRNGDAKTAGDLFIRNDTGLLLQNDAFLVHLLTGANTK